MVRPREFDTQNAVDQALFVFRKQGYKGSSLHDLIRAMGISNMNRNSNASLMEISMLFAQQTKYERKRFGLLRQ